MRHVLKHVKKESQGDVFFTRLKKSLMAGVEFINKHPALYRIYLRILFERDAPLRKDLLQTIRLFSREYLLSLLEEGQARGDIRSDPVLQLNETKGLEEKMDSIVTMLRQGFASANGI